ncbi:calcium-activated chloride channel regulator 2-like [Amblyomma americanum]
MVLNLLNAAGLLFLTHALTVDKEDGGYVGLLVAIDDNVAYDSSVVNSTQVLLREASSILYRATRRHVYFKQVTIALPRSWPRTVEHSGVAVRQVAYHALHRSEMRVVQTARNSGGGAYSAMHAVNPRGCGQRGDHIMISQDALPDVNDAASVRRAAFRLVREWARFRYGVFDEFGEPGSERYPALYCSHGKVLATGCGTGEYILRPSEGTACRMMPGCRFGADCFVEFTRDKGDRSASIMSVLDSTHDLQFCNNESHNAEAPNEHNHLCGGKSTWHVVSQSEDFKGLRPAVGASPSLPTFRLNQEERALTRRLVFVLGLSAKARSRILSLKSAMSLFLNELPASTWVSLITFNGGRTMRRPLSPLDNRTVAALLRQVESMQPDPQLCSSCGVLAALQVLTSSPMNHSEGSTIILATDGPLERETPAKDLIPLLRTQGVLLHGIALTVDARPDLELLASETSGISFVALEPRSLSAALQDVLSHILDVSDKLEKAINSPPDHRPEVANDIMNSSVSRIAPQLAAFYPFGRFVMDIYYKPLVQKIEDALFTVALKKGKALILNASVIATFQLPGHPISTLLLVDTGLGADLTRGDSVYQGYFSKFVGKGRYTVNFFASSTPHSLFLEFIDPVVFGGGHRRRSWVPAQVYPTGPFTVNRTHRSMQVSTDLFERDIPPAPVSRFRVSDTDAVHTDGRRIWTLTWFNGGDHGYEGTAASFELRYSTDGEKLRRNFSSCDIVDPASDLLNGSLVPQPAYTAQAVQFLVPLSITQELKDSGARLLTVYFDIKPVSSTRIIGQGLPIPALHDSYAQDTKRCWPIWGDNDDVDTTVKATTEKPATTVSTGTGSGNPPPKTTESPGHGNGDGGGPAEETGSKRKGQQELLAPSDASASSRS